MGSAAEPPDLGRTCKWTIGPVDGSLTGITSQLDSLGHVQLRMESRLAEIHKDLEEIRVCMKVQDEKLKIADEMDGGSTARLSGRLSNQVIGQESNNTVENALDSPLGQLVDEEHSWFGEVDPAGQELDLAKEAPIPASLPENWPSSCCPRPLVLQIDRHKPLGHTLTAKTKFKLTETVSTANEEPMMYSTVGNMRHFMVNPHSWIYSLYSMCCMGMLTHDIMMVPYIIAWDVAIEGIFFASAFSSCLFWSVDIVVSFLTGYNSEGKLEMRFKQVAKRYAKTWMLPDMVVNVCDWLGVVQAILGSNSGLAAARLVRFTKLLKFLRLISLLRMMRVVKVIEELLESTLPDKARLVQQCFIFFFSMFVINHLVGCTWYYIGRQAPSDTGMRWTDSATLWNGEYIHLLDLNRKTQYLAAVHWSMAQIVGGNMDILAYNSFERVYTMLCLAVGLLFGCTIVSTLSASLVDTQMTRNDIVQKLRKLRIFLQEMKIARGLAMLVQEEAKERLESSAKLTEEDVLAIRCLSNHLRAQLRYEMYKSHILRNALFRLWHEMDPNMVKELCNKAMESNNLSPNDELFVAGSVGDRAYFLLAGRLHYTQEPATAPVTAVKTQSLNAGTWFSEMALWVQWVHVGTASAPGRSQVLTLLAEPTLEIIRKHAVVADVTAEYCRAFIRRVGAAKPPRVPYPSDVEVPMTDFSDLVPTMSQDIQERIGMLALSSGQQHQHNTMSMIGVGGSTLARADSLKEEVLKHKCCVLVNGEGSVERVVSVVVVRIVFPLRGLLVELGKMDACGAIEVSCQLPGCKQEAGEMLNTTLSRLLSRFYLPLASIEVSRLEREVQTKQSKDFGVQTKYVRTIHHITLQSELRCPTLALATKDDSAEFVNGPIYKVQHSGKSLLYTWINPDGFEYLHSPAGERSLSAWLSSLNEDCLEELAL